MAMGSAPAGDAMRARLSLDEVAWNVRLRISAGCLPFLRSLYAARIPTHRPGMRAKTRKFYTRTVGLNRLLGVPPMPRMRRRVPERMLP